MSSLDGSDTNFNPLTLDGMPVGTSPNDVIALISINNTTYLPQNYLLLDTSNDPLTGVLTINGNLSVNNASWFGSNVNVSGQVTANTLQSNTTIGGQSIYCDTAEFGIDSTSRGLLVYNQVSIGNTITGGNHISIAGNFIGQNLSIANRLTVDNISVSGNIICRSRISVSGNVFTQNNVSVAGSITSGSLFTGTTQINGNETVYGNTTVGGTVVASGVSASSYYNVPQFTGNLNGDISVSGSAFVNQTVSVGGNCLVFGQTFLNNNLNVNGLTNLTKLNILNDPALNDYMFECKSTKAIRGISIHPNVGPGAYNPITQDGDTLVLANKSTNALGGGALTLTTHSNTGCGIRIQAGGATSILGSLNVSSSVSANLLYGSLAYTDTRNTNSLPSFYRPKYGLTIEFKISSVIGVPDGSMYSLLHTNNPWGDTSGGVVHQVAYTASGNIYTRSGFSNDTGWNAWRIIVSSSFPDNTTYPINNTSSNLVLRNPSTGELQRGILGRKNGSNSGAWTGGQWLYDIAFRATANTMVVFIFNVQWWATSTGLKGLNINFYRSDMSWLDGMAFYKFFNITGNHEAFTVCVVLGSSTGSYVGSINAYIDAFNGGITSDSNDFIYWTALYFG